jgi:predicted small lipoprotein YifL
MRATFERIAICGENPPTKNPKSDGGIEMKNVLKITAAALCCAALIACSQKGPAEAALTAAQAAVDGVKADAAKYVPNQAKALMASLIAAREAFDKGDYKAAMEMAQAIPAKATDVTAAVNTKKDELTKSWTALSASVPGTVEQVKAKVDALSAMKKLPKDMDAAKLEAAKASLADITKSWGEAEGAFKSGNLADAVAKGNAVKAKVADEMGALGLSAGAPAPAAAAAAAPAPAAKKY